jgi:hypothetical protein
MVALIDHCRKSTSTTRTTAPIHPPSSFDPKTVDTVGFGNKDLDVGFIVSGGLSASGTKIGAGEQDRKG